MGSACPMEGYEVVTSDGRNVGRVAEVRGENVIVEHGLLRKKRHAIPSAFVHTDDDERVVRLTVSRELVEPAAHELGSVELLGRIDPAACEGDRQLEVGRAESVEAVVADVAERTLGSD